ncbi:spore gernimation protein GerPD [Paenibacillus aurantius]|uniref:Spore gernimation protein GerPD n=1 Tax=Paenibacillus aurantius TaxID=2918900 RepID=A0AA96LBD2_9BACL|nr:spore gernimation protein GerPD [Paenibacillus aurantius]WNQ10009.1 spore gernimation protein GerPD [Paenibacillus aurantius]
MNLTVYNDEVAVGYIRIIAVASSSVFLLGDTAEVNLSSFADTPPESVQIGPLVPLPPSREL